MINDKDRNELILIGEIVSPVGIKGQVKVKSYSSEPGRFGRLDFVFCEFPGKDPVRMEVEDASRKGDMPVLKLTGIKDRTEAEAARGSKLYIEEEQLEELPDDTYYVRDLVGLKVLDDETGLEIGSLVDVIQNAAQDIYVIRPSYCESEDSSSPQDIMVPAVKEFIREVNVDEKFVKIKFIEGMLPK